MSQPNPPWAEVRDKEATKYFNDWAGGDAPSFRDGADFGRAFGHAEAQVLLQLVEDYKAHLKIMKREYGFHSSIEYDIDKALTQWQQLTEKAGG